MTAVRLPAAGPKTWSVRIGSDPQRFEAPIDTGLLKSGSGYEVHLGTLEGLGRTQNATVDPVRGHSMPFTY
ncbi:hypothetical protein QEZ40_007145 [Streptomyces katrae]|uniref:Uncharacterized protein n=1 Tax=Streptomyces katrae TaxID=68223 RepID=A0ABT7H4Y8_9ACTN|nr:hypothetical protein [Streptomyces katrae]MDK9500943.1 hypothetical protein [Streptomyces katrae]